MHKTCHQNVKCDECRKEFGTKRNLKRHKKVKHETFKKIEAKTQTQVSEMAMETMQMCLLTDMTH